MVEIPVTDPATIVANAATRRVRAAVKDAVAPRLRTRLTRRLRP
jgi:hypothetical protein